MLSLRMEQKKINFSLNKFSTQNIPATHMYSRKRIANVDRYQI